MKNQNFDWLLVGCHHITEVSVAYYPNYAHNCSAVKALRRTITEHARLLAELTEAGYTSKALHFSPQQLAIIVRHWGLPNFVGETLSKNPYLSVPKKYGKI